MATSVKVGSFTVNGTTGNQSITGLGFQPKAVLFWGGELTVVSGSNEYRRTLGAATSSTARWASMSSYRNATDSCDCQFKTNRCLQWNDALSDSPVVSADFVSMDADGFTINVVTAAAKTIYYFALGGSSVSAKAGTIDSTGVATNGSNSYTGVGFIPKCLLFSTGGDNITQSPSGNVDNCIGWCTGTANQGSNGGYIDPSPGGGVASNVKSVQVTNAALTRLDGSGFVNAQLQLSSFDADGMTLLWKQAPPAATLFGYLALGGTTTYKALAFNEPAATGSQSITGSGIMPQALLFSTVGKATSSTVGTGEKMVLGATTGAAQRATFGISAQDGITSSAEPDAYQSAANCIGIPSTTNGTAAALADLTRFDADGFTLNWSIVDGLQSQVIALAIGSVQLGTTVTGVQATGQLGTGFTVAGGSVTLTGLAATAAIGTVTAAGNSGHIGATVNVSGLAMSGLLGTPAVSGKGSCTVAGLAATSSLGAVGTSNTLIVPLLPVPGAVGLLTPAIPMASHFGQPSNTTPDHVVTVDDPAQLSPFLPQQPPRGW